MALVRDRSKPLSVPALADHLGIKPVQANKVAGLLASRPETGVTLSRSGNLRRKPVSTQPQDVAGFLASKGGIRDNEGHDLIRGRGLQQFVPGRGPLIRPKGMSIDYAGEAMHEAGFFGPPESTPRPTENEVLQLLESTGRGIGGKATKVHTPEDAVAVAADRDAARAQEEEGAARGDIASVGKELNESFTPEDTDAILGIMGSHGLSAEDAAHEYVERLAMKDAHDSAEEAQDDAYSDIPFDTEAGEAQPAEDGRAAGDGSDGRTDQQPDAGESRPVGEPVAEGPREEPAAGSDRVEPTTEKGADGLDQTIVPGAEASARQLAAAREAGGKGKIKPKAQQQDAGGMFADKTEETGDMFAAKQQAREYPLASKDEWYGDANFEKTGGKLVKMSPDEFLEQVRPLEVDDTARENIDDLKRHIESGKTLDPLQIAANGKEDGRHRAIAAKELGIKEVPVLRWEKPDVTEAPPAARPHLDKLERKGGRDVRMSKDVDSKDFVEDFGFRGVEFGNWVAGDERQKSVNLAYDALHDLADTLGIPPKALSLDGKLGLAFGARGKGRAAAHYESGKLVINLTKLSGAGALAHEWGHAVDHYFGMLDRGESSMGQTRGATGWYDRIQPQRMARHLENLRPEMQGAFEKVMENLFQKEKPRAVAVRDAELRLEKVESDKAKYEKQLQDHLARPVNEQNRTWVKQMREWLKTNDLSLEVVKERLAALRDEAQPYKPSKMEAEYYKNARTLSGKAGDKGYWARPTEMFARAFEAYVFDKIKAGGGRSDYLVQGVEADRHASHPDGNPYPAGEERDAINDAFDKLFNEMKVRDSAKGGKELYMRSGTGGNAPLAAGRLLNNGAVRRGAENLINRLNMQVNLDIARARRNGGGHVGTGREDVREVEDFIRFIGEHMFNDVGMRIRADQGPMGSFNTGSRIVTMYRKALDSGDLPRTAVHEFWHHLDDAISDAELEATSREFDRARGKWVKENPWYESFINDDGDMGNRIFGKAADDWVSKYGKSLDAGEWTGKKARIPMWVSTTESGKTMVTFPWGMDNYRYADRDEYFAETLADKYFDHRDMQDEKARSIVAWGRDIWQRMVSGVKRIFGRDATGRIFDGFRDGQYAAPMPHGDIRELEMRRGGGGNGKTPRDDGGDGGEPPPERPQGPVNRLLGESTNDFFKRIGSAVDRFMPESLKDAGNAIQMSLTPMAANSASPEARAAAKDFANAMRKARVIGGRQVDYLAKNFKPDQLKQMWEAADQESVMRQQGQEPGPTQGLNRLTPQERAAVEAYQADSNVLLQQARDIGLFKGEGLPSYVPRMVVAVGADGTVGRLGHGGDKAHGLDAIGRNLKTTSSNLKQRKHLTVEETQKAAEALDPGAVVIKDIRTLPIAMTRLQQAIAGRSLINKIREMGSDSGEMTISEGSQPNEKGWFTIDHPAFKSYRPQLVKNETTGKWEVLKDAEGNELFEKVPLYVRGDFEGPLRAVLSQDQSKIYKAFMDLKGKTMSVIMYSPLMHNAVIWGKALPAAPLKLLNPMWKDADGKLHFSIEIYGRGHAAKNDPATMKEALDNGMDPVGHRFFNQDMSSLMEEASVKPGRSWTAQALAAIPNLFDKGAGDAVKRAVDKAGDVWHNKFLWDRVGDLQMGLYTHLRDKAIKQGIDPQTAGRYAAHFANRYAGALPIESMSKIARQTANMMLFSRSFTLTNLGAFKDIVAGLPKDVQAQILRDKGIDALNRVQGTARRKAIALLGMDIFLSHVGLFMAQYAMAWATGAQFHPPSENEPDRENRFLMGHQDDGTAIYGRLPTGKVGEELQDWITSPMDLTKRKLSPYGRFLYGMASNDQGFGRKIYDPYDETPVGMAKNMGRVAAYAANAVLPLDAFKAVPDVIAGRGDKRTNMAKLLLPLAGFTVSKGAPGGEAVGQMYASKDEHEFKISEAMPDIRKKIVDGDIKGATDAMTKLGMDRAYQRFIVRTTQNPGARLSKKQIREFMGFATDAEKAQMQRFLDRTKVNQDQDDDGGLLQDEQHSALEPSDLKGVIANPQKLASAAENGLSWSRGDAADAMQAAGYPATAELLRAARAPLRPELHQKLLGATATG